MARRAPLVYRALFEHFGSPRQSYVIREVPAEISQVLLGPNERQMLQPFRFTAQAKHRKRDFGSLNVHLLSDGRYLSIFSDSTSCSGGWKNFHEAFPQAKALIELSTVGLNPNGSEAVVLLHAGSACLGGSWDLLYFRLAQGGWTFRESVNVGRA
jgi:hypothetical protein